MIFKMRVREKVNISHEKRGFYFLSPLLLDVVSTVMYLLDNATMRLCLEFAPNIFVINTHFSDHA